MNARERVIPSLNHKEPDKVPLDLGSSLINGIHVSSLHKLKVSLGLIQPDEPVKVIDPLQMLGGVDDDLRKALGVDTIPLDPVTNLLGFENKNWKRWTFFDCTPLLVPEKFNTEPDEGGYIHQYPQGDKSVPPSAQMPRMVFTLTPSSGRNLSLTTETSRWKTRSKSSRYSRKVTFFTTKENPKDCMRKQIMPSSPEESLE